MGAWGYGILQNDAAQDSLAEVIGQIEEDIAALAKSRPGERAAARLGAAVGLLLQMSSWYSFGPENDPCATILRAIERHAPRSDALPRRARKVLADVAAGRGKELAGRPAKLRATLRRALFVTPSDDFPMERVFGRREPSLFAHPDAARYVQTVAGRCAGMVDEDFAEEDVAGDLAREGQNMGAFAVLLVIEPCHVSARRIERWRSAYRRVTVELRARYGPDEYEPDASEQEFEQAYEKCLELAFRLMLKKFSK